MKATNDLNLVRLPVLIDEIRGYQVDIDGELSRLGLSVTVYPGKYNHVIISVFLFRKFILYLFLV